MLVVGRALAVADEFKTILSGGSSQRLSCRSAGDGPWPEVKCEIQDYKDSAKIPATIPPIDVQQAIARILKAYNYEIALLRRQREALKDQRKGLM